MRTANETMGEHPSATSQDEMAIKIGFRKIIVYLEDIKHQEWEECSSWMDWEGLALATATALRVSAIVPNLILTC